ncbi:hypothetical protein P171DRAFT_357126 [Karstenula rhodostoma CBS 690.94]|uniref:Uncharacterized protein n=1 Tax=Karstenula rhodostoma CBS 690.94 TaxID=1392251 RepID=A0A9P4PNZ7_9PLEO|nr:hypothetical protein P171DRAFT_357126 [Karstenula rhodostoma CBS 690.94]
MLSQEPSPQDNNNPFAAAAEADVEWSDEEVLLPKRRKTPYKPPPEIRDDLVKRFYDVTRERDALRKELQRQSMGPHGLPAHASVVYKSDEKALIEELLGLREEIRVWSEDYFTGTPSSSRRRRPHLHTSKELFGPLTDNHAAYLKHATDRPLVIQAFLWSSLQHRIFSTLSKGCGYVWAGKLGDRKLRPLNDTLRKAVKNEAQAEEYHRWRALTVNLLVPQVDGKWSPTFDATPVLKWIKRFCARLRRRLRPWACRSLRDGKEQLYTIVSAAVALDLKMKRQRADYRFITWTGGRQNQFWGYGFYDSEMEDVESEDEGAYRGGSVVSSASRVRRRVELSLAPALERCGNANGHVFDQNFILVKADVMCRRLERAREPVRKKPGIFSRGRE